jgi:adenosylmethionine-8-amino-7-oxononanoate aminotransferase
VFLTSGGGDSIDTAAKLARRYWHELGKPERTVLISRTQGYHGTHGFGTAIGGIAANRVGFGPQVESEQVAFDSLDALAQAIERIGAEHVAAFFIEPVIGAGGVHPPVAGYIEGVAELCRRNDVLLVVDAVICGFGRLGTWFGIERWNVVPDMIAFAKGVTSGYLPLGGVIISERIAEPFWSAPGGPVFRHGATYAGHATCAAAALANIELLERDELLARGQTMEQPLLDALRGLADHSAAGSVRGGIGTLGAVDLEPELLARDPAALGRLTAAAREAGVLVRQLGSGVAVSPPLTATPEHFELIAQALATGLDAAAS